VREFCPKIIFISETRQQQDRVQNIIFRLVLNKCFVVDGHGKGGGLALYWDESIIIDILSYMVHHIDTIIWDGVHHVGWREPLSMENHVPKIDTLCGSY
jgi:hypothetical protein